MDEEELMRAANNFGLIDDYADTFMMLAKIGLVIGAVLLAYIVYGLCN